MHKIFGEKRELEYIDRKGAYLIPIREGKVGVVRTQKGYFLLGGGIEVGESDEMCLNRECLEEIGYSIHIDKYIGSAEYFTTKYDKENNPYPFHPIQSYYIGELLEYVQEPTEDDHILEWKTFDELIGIMYTDMQSFALELCRSRQ